MEFLRKNTTWNSIESDSHTNKELIYKYIMKGGFTAFSANDLATTMVNPTFAADFFKNVKKDWNMNY